MNIFLRFLLLSTLIICYKFLPVEEPKGLHYLISLLCLGVLIMEIKKLVQLIKINESKKIKLQKVGYILLILVILASVILVIHKGKTAGDIRYLRLILILFFTGLAGKVVSIIAKSAVPNKIKNSVLITFSTVSFIGILECIFMFISLSHGGGEAYSGKIWMAKFWNPINKFNFRDTEPNKAKNTIFFIGDSFTAGWGVKKIDDRFGEVAANELRKNGKSINEVNLGKYGADTRLEYHTFQKFIKRTKIKPNQIVLQYFVNDVDKFIPQDAECQFTPINLPNWKKFLIEGSYLVNYINSIYPLHRKTILPKECDYPSQLQKIYSNDSIWKKEELQLDKFSNYCKKHEVKLILLFFPFMEDLNLTSKLGIEKRIVLYSKKNNIKLVDVTKLIRNLKQEERQASMTDSHASAKVHQIVGKKLATIIKL